MEDSTPSSDSTTDPALAFDLDELAVPRSPHDNAKPGRTDPWGLNAPALQQASDSVIGTPHDLGPDTVEASQQLFEPEPRRSEPASLKLAAEARRWRDSSSRIAMIAATIATTATVATAATIAAGTRTGLRGASEAAAQALAKTRAVAKTRAGTLALRRGRPMGLALFSYAVVGVAMFMLGRSTGLPAPARPVVETARVMTAVESANSRSVTGSRQDSAPQAVALMPARDVAGPGIPVAALLVPTEDPSTASPSATEAPAGTLPNTGPPFRGSLAVTSFPSGAQVFVNGVGVGTTPLSLRNLPVGSRAMRLVRDGYEPWYSTVQIVANQRASTVAQLKPLRRAN